MVKPSSKITRHAPGNRRNQMNLLKILTIGGAFMLFAGASSASAFVQYPYDIDNDPKCWTNWAALGAGVCPSGQARGPEDTDWNNDGIFVAPGTLPNGKPSATYMHLSAGDGMAKMADGSDMYIFSFSNLTGNRDADTMMAGSFHAEISAPTIDVSEGQAFYLTLSNVGMVLRPDLFDPHTVHFHGYPNAASVFDGEPMASFGIRMMQELTYFYQPYGPTYVPATSECVDPGSAGTYMYHCHVEATEHMEMGMLGNNIIRPIQDNSLFMYSDGRTYSKYAYNDCLSATDPLCGSTGYDVEKTIQFTSFDPVFHQADMDAQPPPFSTITPVYFLFNGRGYPDTINPAAILNSEGYAAQKLDAHVRQNAHNDTILLRLSNLTVKDFITVEAPGLTFNVVGMCARQLRNPGPDGIYGTVDDQDLSYVANSVMIGPGESYDIIIRTVGVSPGTYHLVSRNLDQLNNNGVERGGAMTEITIL